MVDNLIYPKADAAKPIDPNAMPAFWVGEERPSQIHATEYVLHQVGVALDVNGEDRKFCADRPIQEISLLRAMYHGGDCVIRPGWSPGLSRYKGFTRDQVEGYINWVRGEYVIVGEQKARVLFDEMYRTPREFVRIMKQVWAAWQALIERKKPEILPALIERASEEYRKRQGGRVSADVRPWEFDVAFNAYIQPRDIEEIVALTNPQKDLMDELGLDDAAPAAPPAETSTIELPTGKGRRPGSPPVIPSAPVIKVIPTTPEAASTPSRLNNRLVIDTEELGLDGEAQTLQDHLVGAGYDQDTAMDVSTLAHDHPKGIPDKVLGQIPKFKTAAARAKVKKAIQAYKPATAPATAS